MPKLTGPKYSDIFTPEMVDYYRVHIVEFVEDMIFQNNDEWALSDQQKDFLISIQNNKRTAAKSGRGVGKSSSFAFVVLWFLCCFDYPKVACTAPSFPNLESVLWPEVALWLDRSIFSDIFEHTSKRLYLKEKPKNWWAEPRTAKDKESFGGLHADNLLILIDEGSGFDDEIFEALDSTLTRGKFNKIATAGNPTRVTGFFYDCFTKFSNRWNTFTFNAEESPIASKDNIEYYGEKYGRDHPLYMVNVLGEFPEANPDAFIALADVQKAVNRDIAPEGTVEIGVDVARFGEDSTVVFARQGMKVFPAWSMPKSATNEVVDLVLRAVAETRQKTGYKGVIRVKVDDIGVGGGVTDYLKLDRENKLEIIPCAFGRRSNDEYYDETSIFWGLLKDYIPHLDLPDDQLLVDELAARKWRPVGGKIRLQPKEEFKRDFKSSPDRADALVLCLANKVPERTVLKNFDPLDGNIVKSKHSYSGTERFCSIYFSRDLMASVIYASWDGNKICIEDEYKGDDPLIYVATHVRQREPFNRILGNNAMFGQAGEDLASKFRKFRVNVKENYKYDELGAIEMLGVLTTQKRVLLTESCRQTIEQLSKWKMEGSKINQEVEFGLCYAICNLISELRKRMQQKITTPTFQPYTGEKQEFLKNVGKPDLSKKFSWMLA